ncbi:MAG: DUF503 domain-containing protein [Thermoanaerobaculia bacterium]
MVVALTVFEFHLPGCRGLKEKRSFLRPLKARLRGDFEISAAEVAHQDLLQRASLGIAAVGPDPEALEPLLMRIRRFIESYAEENGAEIASERHEFVGFGDVGAPGSSFGAGSAG